MTVFLAVVFCAAITMMLISAVAFIQDKKMFSSAPKEAQEAIRAREKEVFYGARTIGWVLMGMSILMIAGVGVTAISDGYRNDWGFWQFFLRFVMIFSLYKAYDMIFFDWFLLCRSRFFGHYFPEVKKIFEGRKYGYNLKSQLVKLVIVFPAASALGAWVCSLF